MYAIIIILALIALIAPAYLKVAVLVAAAGPVLMVLAGFLMLGLFMLTGRHYVFFQRHVKVRRFFRNPMMGRQYDEDEK